MSDLQDKGGILAWFAGHHVAANLLMFFLIGVGILSLGSIKIEVFPEISPDTITVTVPYLGASPEEVEEGVCLRVEESLAGLEGIKRLRSSAAEGMGVITVEVEEYADLQEVLDDVKAAVDRIITFPEETEKPIIKEITSRTQVISIVIYGDVAEKTLKDLAEQVRDDLTALDNISQVDIAGVRNYEISIEVSEENLRRYGLSFDQVGAAVRSSSLDLPGGSVKTQGGEILVRTKGQRYRGQEFESIVVMTRPDGTQLLLSDIATVVDGFEDSDKVARFDGMPAAQVRIQRVGDQDALDVAATVKRYVQEKQRRLPEGISLATWFDRSAYLKSRLNLLLRNAYFGLTLVVICLAFFLDLRVAFWTALGIPISFLGAFCFLGHLDISVNMISLFAFIVALGIVVDDAIVVGENIFSYLQQGMPRLEAAIRGAKEMAIPVSVAVFTTMFAFVPLMFTTGMLGKIIYPIPVVVICVFSISLVEALLILPAHLSGGKRRRRKGPIGRLQARMRDGVQWFINHVFSQTLTPLLRWRYATLALAVAVLALTAGYVAGGHIKFTLMPKVDADNMWASLTMPQGTSRQQTEAIVRRIEAAAEEVRRQYDAEQDDGGPSILCHMATNIGEQPFSQRGGPRRGDDSEGLGASHLAEVNIELLSGEQRQVSSTQMANRWREQVGEIPGVSALTFTSTLFSAGDAVNVELAHEDFDTLLEAVERLKEALAGYEGVSDITDSFETGKKELKLSLRPEGRLLRLTLADLARQVRQGFYGYEVQRIQRGRDDIRIMVRYPEAQRKSLGDIENMRIRLPDGVEVPFTEVAEVQFGRGYATIARTDRRRVVSVTADVDEKQANANEINRDLAQGALLDLQREYPGLTFNLEGQQKEQRDSMNSLRHNFIIALLGIFGLLAVQFRSYLQPIIIMSAIPFGLIGAVAGHVLLGYDLTMLSLFGIVALTGVVVNDSLILVDLINRSRDRDAPLLEVVRASAVRRFRPIILTTLTTFFGLTPMIMEKSLQARFLVPMAISLGFGVVFATGITLGLVPTLYLILDDIKHLYQRIFSTRPAEGQKTEYA
ncbi:MAG: efflux RND transporter permease subunit [Sedimentisphaerales bacterium]|nr:efflux RND transporter permease subunit [Sedimentisphaerales bacterium]